MPNPATQFFLLRQLSIDFKADVLSGEVPLTVNFTKETESNPTSFAWDFGDGESSDEQNPGHVYNNVGTYTVILTASESGVSDTETKINYIIVTETRIKIYDMIAQAIREADKEKSSVPYLLQRYLLGPQAIFNSTQDKIKELLDLMNYKTCPDELLQYLKATVGFTEDLNYITAGLNYTDLRKVILTATTMWREKGLEIGLRNMIRLFTGKESIIRDWFAYRFLIDESQLGEAEGNDIEFLSRYETTETRSGICNAQTTSGWIDYVSGNSFTRDDLGAFVRISGSSKGYNGVWEVEDFSGVGDTVTKLKLRNFSDVDVSSEVNLNWELGAWDQFTIDIKVEKSEDATVYASQRDILKKTLSLVRPSSERFRILYLNLIDHFRFQLANWNVSSGTVEIIDEELHLEYDTKIYEVGHLSKDWENYSLSFKFNVTNPAIFFVYFYMQDYGNFDDSYFCNFDTVQNRMQLFKNVAGTPTLLSQKNGLGLNDNEDYLLRVNVIKDETSGDTVIRIFLDSEEIFNVSDSTFSKGSIGFKTAADSKAKLNFVEVFGDPWDIDYVTN